MRYLFPLLLLIITGCTQANIKHSSWPNTPLECLAANIYHEARGEPLRGQLAVGVVTLNRVSDKRWPSTICGVVKDKHQFSWYWDNKSDIPERKAAWRQSLSLAKRLLAKRPAIVPNAKYYWNPDKAPFREWMRNLNHVASVGKHVFYTD